MLSVSVFQLEDSEFGKSICLLCIFENHILKGGFLRNLVGPESECPSADVVYYYRAHACKNSGFEALARIKGRVNDVIANQKDENISSSGDARNQRACLAAKSRRLDRALHQRRAFRRIQLDCYLDLISMVSKGLPTAEDV